MGQLEKSVFIYTQHTRVASGTFKGIHRVFEDLVPCLYFMREEGQDLDHIY